MAKSTIHGKESKDVENITPADFILKTVDKLEREFKRILNVGMDKYSPFYDYIDDIRVAAKKLK